MLTAEGPPDLEAMFVQGEVTGGSDFANEPGLWILQRGQDFGEFQGAEAVA
jgi:hypothetical protein